MYYAITKDLLFSFLRLCTVPYSRSLLSFPTPSQLHFPLHLPSFMINFVSLLLNRFWVLSCDSPCCLFFSLLLILSPCRSFSCNRSRIQQNLIVRGFCEDMSKVKYGRDEDFSSLHAITKVGEEQESSSRVIKKKLCVFPNVLLVFTTKNRGFSDTKKNVGTKNVKNKGIFDAEQTHCESRIGTMRQEWCWEKGYSRCVKHASAKQRWE
uniref:Uncharacterized protein n=1 Tax=Cucumis melo TaxID=3656 RepID=A0A9I9EHA4_CUCME